MPVAVAGSLDPLGRGEPPPGVPVDHWRMYTPAAAHYKVNPYLLASIHKVESDFGRATGAGVTSGANTCGAAGPMQFGVVGVAPYNATGSRGCSAGSTWRSHWTATRPIAEQRPEAYPLERSTLPSCREVPKDVGCVYDSYDAIAGTAHKLHADGADASLYSRGTYRAVLAYNPSAAYVEEVLSQARRWELEGVGASISLDDAIGATRPRSLERLRAVAEAIDGLTRRGQIPYCWGGGHGSRPGPSQGDYCWEGERKVYGSRRAGLDCSGAVRWLLTESGFPDPGGVSARAYGSYLISGSGTHFSIYYSPSHIWVTIDGRAWQTSVSNPNHGPGWTSSRSAAGYSVGHLEGI